MKRFYVTSILFLTIFSLISSIALIALAEETPDAKAIVKKVDMLYRSKSSQGKVEMTIVTEHWMRTLKMDIWSEGMDKTFIYITYPKKDNGIATLRLENEMWNYFPKINKVMKVPPSMMMSSWMGSDFTNDDLVKESSMLRDYFYKLIKPDDSDPGYYYIELTPKEDIPTVWGKITITVRKGDYIPVREVYYDEKGNKMRVMHFKEITVFGNRSIPAVIELIPLNKKGKKTIIRYKTLQFDIKPEKDIFTLRNLQKRR